MACYRQAGEEMGKKLYAKRLELDLGKENAREGVGDALAGPWQHLSWGHAQARAAASHGSRASALRVCFAMRH